MRIYPTVHYTMGGRRVDYDLQATIRGLFVIGEANFSDHGTNRLGASVLMQGLTDGYFVLPATISGYLVAERSRRPIPPSGRPPTRCTTGRRFLPANGTRTVDSFDKELGGIVWDYCGMERLRAGLEEAIEWCGTSRRSSGATSRSPARMRS